MKRILFSAALAATVLAHAALARPILSDSQKSYAAVCLENMETPERLAAICETALADGGIAAFDLYEMRVNLALAYDTLGEVPQALAQLNAVLNEDPAHTSALNALGWVHWGTGDYGSASDAFQRSLDTGASAQGLAGLASSGRSNNTLSEDEYLQLIDAAIAMSPSYTWAMRDKAWFYIDSGRPAEAEPVLQTALHEDEDDAWTHYAMGVALYDQDKYAAALERLNRAIETGQAPTYAYLYRARSNFWVQNYRRALVDAERVTQDWPEAAEGPVWKARALSALGLRPAGITVLRDFLEKGHNNFATYWLSELLYYGGDEAEAIAVLQTNIDAANADYYDHEMMAMMFLETEQFVDARTHIAAALKLDPDAYYPVYYKSLIEVSEGNFDTGEQLFLEALKGGLPRRHIRNFIGALTDEGALKRAVAFRHKTNLVTAPDE